MAGGPDIACSQWGTAVVQSETTVIGAFIFASDMFSNALMVIMLERCEYFQVINLAALFCIDSSLLIKYI